MVDRTPVQTGGTGSTGGTDWTVELTNRIESTVATVRDNTTVPVTKAAEAIVFGVVAALLAVVAVVFLVIVVVRLLNVYLPIHPLSRRVWVSDLIAAAIFLGSGAFLWLQRQPKEI
jgi:hypothetical protein